MRIDSYSKTIALATTPVNLVAAASGTLPQYIKAHQVFIRCPSSNTSDILIGSSDRQVFTVLKGTMINLSHISKTGQSGSYELDKIFVKAGTNNDVVEILLLDPANS